MKRKKIWVYIDGKKLVEVIQAALDNNMTVIDMKALLVKENPGYEVTLVKVIDYKKKLNGRRINVDLRNLTEREREFQTYGF